MNTRKQLIKIGALAAAFSLTAGVFINLGKKAFEVNAYSIGNLAKEIDLNDCTEQEIRDYYSNLNSLDASERQGTNLLIQLKDILSTNQVYFSYDSGDKIWQMYEITDRDWEKSPASSTVYGTYDPVTNTISNYQYGESKSNSKNNPYIHALYINRDIDNQTTAWDDHNQDAWGINQEHIWAKSHGFDTKGSDSSGGARGDPMHLWAGNGWANNVHSNNFFGFVDIDREYTDSGTKYQTAYGNLSGFSRTVGGNETVFEPQDDDKGDIARAIFYMVARYNNYENKTEGIDGNNPNLILLNDLSENTRTGTSAFDDPYGMGLLSDLLAWNKLDPVDEYEVHRNNLLYKNYTNNRNPFIDFPNWADAIWGTADIDGTNYSSAVVGYASPTTDPIGSVTGPLDISDETMEIIVGDTAEISAKNALDVITWTVENDSIVSLNKTTSINKEKLAITALSIGTTTITATCNGVDVSCTVTVREPTAKEAIERTDTVTSLAYRYTRDDAAVIPSADTLTKAKTGVSSNYVNWQYNSEDSDVVYKGNSGGTNNSIQLRSSDNSGIVITTNTLGQKAQTITVAWNSSTANGRTLNVYGKNTAYSSTADLYSTEEQGTLLGTIVNGTSTSLTITNEYEYIGLKSKNGAMYLSEIDIQWNRIGTVFTYSDSSIRFTGLLSQELWNDLDTENHVIEGFGVMIATDDVINETANIKDSYESAISSTLNPDVTEDIVDYFVSKDTKATPTIKGDDYYWNLKYNIAEENYATTYVAVAYIKTSTSYVFFKQTRYSVKSLAEDYIANRGYDSATANGSLANLANI